MEVGDGGGGGTGGGGGGGGVGGDGSFNKRKMEDEGDGESQRSAKNPRSASPDFTGLKVLISLHVLYTVVGVFWVTVSRVAQSSTRNCVVGVLVWTKPCRAGNPSFCAPSITW